MFITGDCSFGQPVRITANTYIGKSGVLNIEREVAMSGTTHSKGVFILSAYIGEKYAQEVPLSLTASLCFEQMYNGVDGDSASSTELYAIISSSISGRSSTSDRSHWLFATDGHYLNISGYTFTDASNKYYQVTDPYADRYTGYSSGKYNVNNTVVKAGTEAIGC